MAALTRERRSLPHGDPLAALLAGEPRSWDAFVRRYAALIVAAVRGVAATPGDVEDLSQEVFVRLCKDDFRLLRSYDSSRASLSTWITIVARSTARDAMRRRRPDAVPIEAVPEAALKVDAVEPLPKLKLPEALLSPRQREILGLLYDAEMDVAEVAAKLAIDPQTVRSAHHKAMLKLRAHFKADME
ncbi:MAG: sigma-70 family RNA polymerase sigma factor [Alphaproteobacteria bacterium]|nr:sigma-70 family RNA polymerase sigma factor [Alphaproteobacteria bacterium]MBV9553576.1 sigma-70 family RNA polymerase sigma factor [Alphaproteobacteria bacterium]